MKYPEYLRLKYPEYLHTWVHPRLEERKGRSGAAVPAAAFGPHVQPNMHGASQPPVGRR